MRSWRLPRRAAPILLAVLALVLLDRVTDRVVVRVVLADLDATSRSAAMLRVAVLRAEVEKQRSLPVILAQDPDLQRALETLEDGRLRALDRKLERLATGTRTAVIYALDLSGMAVAASNWREPTSFVGIDYAFRPYFRDALAAGMAEHFALGTVSNRPGLYLSRRLDGPAGPVGVIVIKAEFAEVEEAWARLPEPVLTTDAQGIVTVTSVPDWHFRVTRPLPPESRRSIRESLQFGDTPLAELSLEQASSVGGRTVTRIGGVPAALAGPFLAVTEKVPDMAWHLTLLAPLRPALEPVRITARLAVLALGAAGIGLLAWLRGRRRRARAERAREQALRLELEARVGARTAELRAANESLRAEAEERLRAEATVHRMRDELGQANRLAVLGQITASVAHEINQPLAAIRTFADNAAVLAGRGDVAAARKGLETIAALTERIGAITGELRGFARKASAGEGPVGLRTAIDGALLLLGHRLRQQGIAVEVLVAGDPLVRAERVRLEQVLVNLLGNAIEALQDRPDGRIRLEAGASGNRLRLAVADNGPGLAETVRAALFMPFTTTKSAGLGLGLVISREILAGFGGTLEAPPCESGACFVLELEKAG
ncbi:sensor histidine kinase [Teichococcus oryzae]|uniref:histidine kinase n=1 Tax=Teichococcus oryzae TaxID=1608942 RepID=A0A5B2TEM8_9PROT|nr:ATP-binding protein [Pseudoroseomonas oryzae]KAA2212485.1 sensor histidine kinase [Pseudoroseomonas oryzae]